MWLDLPIPPSLNNAYANTRAGRVKTEALKRWIDEAGQEIVEQRAAWPKKKNLIGPYDLSIYLPQQMRGDIGNREKAISDLLATMRLTMDDRHMHALHIFRAINVPTGRAWVNVAESVGTIECPWK